MARIELRGIAHSYVRSPVSDDDYALKPLDIVWESGGAYALLGPSGCGKTTLLNIMSGLLRPLRGSVMIDDRDVTAHPPERRNIAQVFQFPVCYDTMSVFDNLAFPLRNRGVGERDVRARVQWIAALLELEPDLKRKATQLSAEMKQRISLGRGLVRTDVAAILLDEPLTIIDPQARWRLRRKLKEIHAELGVTLVYVTHDQVEALTLADRVVVMNEGRVLQEATPQELFERPAHTFVGYFIGSPGMNLLRCTLADGVELEGQTLAIEPGVLERARARGGESVLGVRPEWLRLVDQPRAGATLAGIVERVDQLGHATLVGVRIGDQSLSVRLQDLQPMAAGAPVFVEFSAASNLLYVAGQLVA